MKISPKSDKIFLKNHHKNIIYLFTINQNSSIKLLKNLLDRYTSKNIKSVIDILNY
jgi:hypothetical protein